MNYERASLGWGLLVGGGVWATGFLTEQFWQPLARYTFNVVAWMLALIYPRIVNDPARLVIGTPKDLDAASFEDIWQVLVESA